MWFFCPNQLRHDFLHSWGQLQQAFLYLLTSRNSPERGQPVFVCIALVVGVTPSVLFSFPRSILPFVFLVLGIESMTMSMLSRCSTPELHLQCYGLYVDVPQKPPVMVGGALGG